MTESVGTRTPRGQALRDATEPFCERDDRIAAASYFGTFAVYFLTLWLAVESWPLWWLTAPLVVVNSFAAVRLYVLQHDTGHASLFSTRRMNDLAGYGLSTFTLTPYRAMQHNHNAHHAHLGNLEHRETTEILTMTVREWHQAGFWKRLYYRIYRNPLIMLPIGGTWTFGFAYRWPKNTPRIGVAGVMIHNIALLAWLGLLYLLGGWTALGVFAATLVVSGCIGVFLVYLQHNFEETYWDRRPDLRFEKAALDGSSTLDFGWWFDLGTGNIAYHDLHHFNPRIPSYRLRKCHFALREQFDLPVIRFPQAVASFGLKLWDEEQERLVSFAEAERRGGAQGGAPGGVMPAE